jgi:hypothetical protein
MIGLASHEHRVDIGDCSSVGFLVLSAAVVSKSLKSYLFLVRSDSTLRPPLPYHHGES